MKRILLLVAIVFSTLSFGQSLSEKMGEIKLKSVGATAKIGTISGVGFFYEDYFTNSETNKTTSIGLEALITNATVNHGKYKASGKGYETNIMFRSFFKNNKGFYYKNAIGYGSLEFDKTFTILPFNTYIGSYRYFSFFQPEIGYDILIAKKLRLNFNFGTQWQIELKGKGDVDNKTFDNWLTRGGARLSYDF